MSLRPNQGSIEMNCEQNIQYTRPRIGHLLHEHHRTPWFHGHGVLHFPDGGTSWDTMGKRQSSWSSNRSKYYIYALLHCASLEHVTMLCMIRMYWSCNWADCCINGLLAQAIEWHFDQLVMYESSWPIWCSVHSYAGRYTSVPVQLYSPD